MKRFPILLAAMTAVPGIATELHVFSAGQPAKAQEVNDNFQRLDTAIQNRATKASLESTDGALKSVMSTVGTLQIGKAEKSDLDALSAKQKSDVAALAKATVDSAAKLREAMPTAVDVSGKADSGWVRSSFVSRDGSGALLDHFRVNSGATDISDGAPWYGIGRASIPTLSPSGTTPQVQLAGYFGLRLKTSGHKLDIPQSHESPVLIDGNAIWHSANLTGANLPGGPYLSISGGDVSGGLGVAGGIWVRPSSDRSKVLPSLWGASFGGISMIQAPNDEGVVAYGYWGSSAVFSVVRRHYVESASRDTPFDANSPDFWVDGSGVTHANELHIGSRIVMNGIAESDVADYVFEPDYQLMSLSEVEAFTKANKHLPEVPSAKEMTENGVDMAAMNMVLLKKVEELTLHAIALQKDVEAQKALLVQQKAQFEERLQRLESTSR
ncbi:MAG TPA: hypothetical protein PK208_05835 [Fibrobacteria bacterium]|nr:hypothetical protein [Fibrobacteria bacterium]